jgi:hypothetical protein
MLPRPSLHQHSIRSSRASDCTRDTRDASEVEPAGFKLIQDTLNSCSQSTTSAWTWDVSRSGIPTFDVESRWLASKEEVTLGNVLKIRVDEDHLSC